MKNNTMIPYNIKKDLETNYYNKTEIELLVAGAPGGSIDTLKTILKELEDGTISSKEYILLINKEDDKVSVLSLNTLLDTLMSSVGPPNGGGSSFTIEDKTKLDGIEEGATADQTAEEIEALYESNLDTNKYTDAEKYRVAVSVSLQTTAQTLPDAINEIDSKLDYLNVSRADKVLANKDVAKLIYDNGNLVKIRYTIDDDTDYEVLTYVGEDLTNVAHYIGGVLQGNTVLTYSDGNLVSSIFVGV